LVDGVAAAFAGFVDRYGLFFRARGRDNAAVATR
jgi:hypothetical protein